MPLSPHYDVIIIGGGHNGLVAAGYLGQAGKKVLLLERNSCLGGATISERIFPDFDARLSRYSYLISLLPAPIRQDLGVKLSLKQRRIASFTPYQRGMQAEGLFVHNDSARITAQSVKHLAGHSDEYKRFRHFLRMQTIFAEKVWPTLLQPLVSKETWRQVFSTPEERKIWEGWVEEPLGHSIEQRLHTDLLRGVVLTDAKIGVFTHAHDPSLVQNRTFLYHIMGNGTGEWRVPVGGMGALVNELVRVALSSGVTLQVGATAQHIKEGPDWHTVVYTEGKAVREVKARYVLVNAAPAVLSRLLHKSPMIHPEDEGSVFKINMLLKKLPRLRCPGVSPEEAFAGTFHVNEGYEQMEKSYREAKAGGLPETLPFEIYCHTLTDPSILSGELAQRGYHTLTLFGLDVPYFLFEKEHDTIKKEAVRKYLTGLNTYLTDPIEECLAVDAAGQPCLESKSPVDIAQELNMPRGNIFHNALSWFFAETPGETGTWGVQTGHERIYICGSGAQRGGAVSGIPGHNAAMAVLNKL